jgi:hypothetical protein
LTIASIFRTKDTNWLVLNQAKQALAARFRGGTYANVQRHVDWRADKDLQSTPKSIVRFLLTSVWINLWDDLKRAHQCRGVGAVVNGADLSWLGSIAKETSGHGTAKIYCRWRRWLADT